MDKARPMIGRISETLATLIFSLLLMSPTASAQQATTTVRGEIVEKEVGHATWRRTFTFQLFGKSDIREEWSNARIDDDKTSAWNGASTLGAEIANRTWHVLSPHRLQRIARYGDAFITLMTLTFDSKGNCHVDRRYMNRTGSSSNIAFHTISSQCFIE